MKTYVSIDEWYHEEIDYHEMVENFRYTDTNLRRLARKNAREGLDILTGNFPQDYVTLMEHSRAWEYDEKTGKERMSKNQMFQFWNKQLNHQLCKVLEMTKPKLILDVCAGSGTLAKILTDHGFNVVAVDNYEWPFENRVFDVKKMDYKDALAKYQPDVVIGCWMPLGTNWTLDFRRTKSVKHYIQIGEVNACCGGDWEDRKTWPIQRCDEASEYAICRTDMIMFSDHGDGKYNMRDFMMHHSAVYITSRRKFALTLD